MAFGLTPSGPLPIHELVIKVDRMFSKKGSPGGSHPSMNKRKMTVRECKPVIEEAEFDKLLTQEAIAKEAVMAVESDGIVFIDEIDKIVSSSDTRHGADASSEGVQRDLLPIIEGSVISTKYGNVSTDHILFIASGAFSQNKPGAYVGGVTRSITHSCRIERFNQGRFTSDFNRTESEHFETTKSLDGNGRHKLRVYQRRYLKNGGVVGGNQLERR